ncbi:DUF6790 family protein [Puniceicoccus vermicola]|uniref:Uncharacterized protein n=1 Tax=Puniceicoccus vermicola TaxID=388746 RepID=A0A7X1AYQ8_9BACT|nr:DUF6790 family protein [Puniceicoccus vermicola]MBC2602441.1 hypothetical protein [Puniceicoccus vermicola]
MLDDRDSPFQHEVRYASLGFAIVALCGHIHQIIQSHNDSPGNAEILLWTNILTPSIGLVLLLLAHRKKESSTAA